MCDTAIQVRGLSKCYRIGQGGWLRRKRPEDIVWALRDVSFDVRPGEVLGVIGRNGAGKSTLLRILSRITEPDLGQAQIHGRVGSLLEVGAGFHPELTGRENVFLNGAILGMKRAEIKARFDEIVAFSGVERFLDTPVKRYSSGMYTRLAFAVAAHLNTEILLIDEVLAVGDAEFQKKCLGKMSDVARGGRTVLFVSHNMGAVRELCHRAMVLHQGRAQAPASPQSAVESYLRAIGGAGLAQASFDLDPSKPICFTSVAVSASGKDPAAPFDIGDDIEVRIAYRVCQKTSGANLDLLISREGAPVFTTFDCDLNPSALHEREPGDYVATVPLPRRLLKAGLYAVSLTAGCMSQGLLLDRRLDAASFEVHDLTENTTTKGYENRRPGVIIVPVKWRIDRRLDA